MVKKACRFFALGKCTRGHDCTYSHEIASSVDAPLTAAPFVPPPHFTASPSSPTETQWIPCRFHLLGRCNKGLDCPYKHLNESTSTSIDKKRVQSEAVNAPSNPIYVQGTKFESHYIPPPKHSLQETEVRNLRGASVMFGPGAQVQDLEFPSDYSAVQMTSLQPKCDAETFQKFLATLGENVPLSSIRIKTVTKPPSVVAHVSVRDPEFSHRLKLKADIGVEGLLVPNIAIGIMQVGIKSESSANRLQMSTVSCTWYKPSRVAWLHYNNVGKARAAERFITSRDFMIAGRQIEATLQIPEHHFGPRKPTITSVQLGNLDASTSQHKVEEHIPGHLTPVNVVMGQISYSTSSLEAEESVKALLNGIGPLEAWEPNSTMSAVQVKAIARFQSGEHARKAVNELSGQKMPQFANSKLFVSPLISVKFNVPRVMYSAIRGDVDRLKYQIWDAPRVNLKAYPPIEPTQKLIALRLYGEDAKAVAKAKSALETILAGDVAMNGDHRIWDDFFINSGGLMYLNELGHKHQGYIHRDMRKHRLSLYGSADSKKVILNTLMKKLDSLAETTHYISLSAEDLKKALQGGFRRIVATLGKQKASLDIRQRPQSITIIGSAHDFERARALLDQNVATDLEHLALDDGTDQPDCVVCWTEAEDAYRTPCGHFYCQSCFASQCTSAGEGDLPVRCFGDSGNCLQVLGIQELKSTLTSEAFEQLLEDSFATHVRTNPKSFQDCQKIYRISPNGVIFTCPTCLTPICTTCQTTSHDGMTCELYKRVGTEGNEAFQKWKQENDVKDCPVCKVPIEKSYGCNHMECRNCKAHICWACLETFDEGSECYTHMQEAHRTMYED